MKGKTLVKVISCLLAIWYLVAETGFNLHSCRHEGRVFLSSIYQSDCRSIHPSEPCSDMHDCPSEEGCSLCCDDCCSNSPVYLQTSGVEDDHQQAVSSASFMVSIVRIVAVDHLALRHMHKGCSKLRCGPSLPLLSVWRN